MDKRNGLVLLVTLMLLALALAVAWSLASWVVLATHESEHARRLAILRLATQVAAQRGQAELQRLVGPDAVRTFNNAAGELQVLRPEGVAPESGNGEFFEQGMRLSWRLFDEAMAFDDGARYRAQRRASAWARTVAGRQKLPLELAAEALSPRAEAALAWGAREWFEHETGRTSAVGIGWQSRGLLTDARRGGWRQDLAVPANLGALIGEPLANHLLSPALGVSPGKGYPALEIVDAVRAYRHLPAVADFRLSLGFFNSRNDGRHRLRFHGSMVFWNPSAAPLLAGPQGRLFLVEIDGAPEVTITNVDTRAQVIVNLDDCPQEDFGVIRQGLRERGLWFWAGIDDPDTYGMSARGLLPGEVYALVSPAPSGQPQGLARILSPVTWKLDRQPHGPSWKRPAPTVFTPSDRIEIAVRFLEKVTLRLRPVGPEPSRDVAIQDYPMAPVIELRNISFPDFLVRTTGEDYSREDSSGYRLEERRACLRLKWRDPPAGETPQAERWRADWDFDDPAAGAEWKVDHPLLAALDIVDFDVMPLMGPWWDAVPNRHAAEQPGAFASLRGRDLPARPILSVGTLRWLEKSGGEQWMSSLDNAYWSASPRVAEAATSDQPWLVSWRQLGVEVGGAATTGAASLVLDGVFNINSRSIDAWEAWLRGSVGRWTAEAGGPWPAGSLRGPLFFLHPNGAGLAKWGATGVVDLPDGALGQLSEGERPQVEAQQAVRQLEPTKLRRWAERLVELQPSLGWPYASLESFARSGLLDQSLAGAEINQVGGLEVKTTNLRLTGADLLEGWAPLLAVRGDTFTVIGRAEWVDGGGVMECETVLQRVPAAHAAGFLGRQFRIISIRFRNR